MMTRLIASTWLSDTLLMAIVDAELASSRVGEGDSGVE
jgi:hypothetical protein